MLRLSLLTLKQKVIFSGLPRLGPRNDEGDWIPACAGMTNRILVNSS